MGKNVIMTNEGVVQFSNALELLSSSIKEFSEVIDRLIPVKLLHDGLSLYLKDFCNSIAKEMHIKISYEADEYKERWDETLEISLFQTFKSLLFFVLKYNQPDEIAIHLHGNNNEFDLQIEDNGKKLDIFNLDSIGANELEQIKIQVNAIKGTFNLWINSTDLNTIKLQGKI
jgi:signal transduction histidine kinase